VGRDPGDPGRAAPHVGEWNRRFAYPRIIPGGLDEYLAQTVAAAAPVGVEPGSTPPDAVQLERVTARRRTERAARVDRLLAPLVQRLDTPERGLAAVAAQFAFLVPGTLVFNPSPFDRTDVARLPDGAERLVTDVPAFGYVCVPGAGDGAGGARWTPSSERALILRNANLAVDVDAASGALRWVTATGGREWVSSGGAWNTFPDAALIDAAAERNAAVGERLVLRRRIERGWRLTTTVTLYHHLPWLDIENVLEAPAGSTTACELQVALGQPAVRWEIPAGTLRAPAPVEQACPLRWLRLEAGPDQVTIAGLALPLAAVGEDGRVRFTLTPGASRMRMHASSGFSRAEDPWRAGWSVEPFGTAPVPGNGRARLPSFGRLIAVDQVGVILLDLRSARDGNGVIVLLQELLGAARDVTLGPGVLGFSGGWSVDFLERDLEPLPRLGASGVAVPIAAHGVAAVRLTDVRLAGQ